MTNLHQRLAKLEALTEARGATPAEGARARELAAKLRARLSILDDPGVRLRIPDEILMPFLEAEPGEVVEFMERWMDKFKQSGRRVVSPAWDPSLQGKVFK